MHTNLSKEDQDIINHYQTVLEKHLVQLPPKKECDPHKMFLVGYLQSRLDSCDITEDIHDFLYLEFIG